MSETDGTSVANDNEEALAYLQGQAADEPGDRVGTVVHEGTKDNPIPATLGTVESAGYVTIFNTQTGDPSICNRNMLMANLRKTFKDGTRVFTLNDPGFRPQGGNLKCRLHKDDPDRGIWDGMGLSVCVKANLKSEFERLNHLTRKHKTEAKVVAEEDHNRREAEYQRERQEDRAFQRTLMEKLMSDRVVKEHVNEQTSE